jgi:hypothetical protein
MAALAPFYGDSGNGPEIGDKLKEEVLCGIRLSDMRFFSLFSTSF